MWQYLSEAGWLLFFNYIEREREREREREKSWIAGSPT
jgi:hypothetical protein